MAEQAKLPTEQEFNEFVGRLREFRRTLPEGDQRMLDVMARCKANGTPIDEADTSYYLGRETLVLTRRQGMAAWRKMLFRFLSRNARSATDFFAIPVAPDSSLRASFRWYAWM